MTERTRPLLVLVDGHALAYRAFFALPANMATSKGELTNAVYGFTSMLLQVLNDVRPDYIAVTFDVGRTFRHDTFADYKGHRAKQPEELSAQMERIRQVVEAFNIPVFAVEGFEADDVIGTLARQAEQQGVETLIVTGDTDAFQLINAHTKVMTSGRRFSDVIIYDEKRVQERYGLAPHQLVDYKALVGDPSDNIPGVRGIGQKTARALLQKYGSLDAIYAHLEEVTPPRARRALEAGREIAFLSRDLARIRTDVPVTLDLNACRTRDFDRERVLALFRELEFRSLVARVPKADSDGETGGEERRPATGAESRRPVAYHVVATDEALDALAERLANAEFITFDVETDSTDAVRARLVGLALSVQEGEGFYIPIAHTAPGETSPNLPLARVQARIAPFLADGRVPARAHNAKFDLLVLRRHGFHVTNVDFDTMIAAWLINPGHRNYGLKGLAFEKLGVEMTPITDLIGSRPSEQISMGQVPVEQAAAYACADVDMTTRLVRVLGQELRERAQWKLFAEVEMPLVPILAEMELAGVALDVHALQDLESELRGRLRDLEREIFRLVGFEFNVNSGPQLSRVLFEHLGLSSRGVRRTKTGHYSTAAGVLETLRGLHPVVDLVLEHRHLNKLLSTYVEQLPRMVNPSTGRIHTDYSQTGTETGRLSSSNPNLQNIPVRTEIGRRIRRAFVAAPGCVLLSADYSQIELRVLAHLSGDPKLIEVFEQGGDVHRATAATIFGVPPDEVTPAMRDMAKRVNFGLLYGMSAWRLARDTGISREEAQAFLERYFANFPTVADFMEHVVQQARERGYTETILGRRRYFPELRSDSGAHANLRRAAERAARNHPIQGSAADIIKLAMINVHRALNAEGCQARMILQVHDELVFEVPQAELDAVARLVSTHMSRAYALNVPLSVDIKVGPNWDEMVPPEQLPARS